MTYLEFDAKNLINHGVGKYFLRLKCMPQVQRIFKEYRKSTEEISSIYISKLGINHISYTEGIQMIANAISITKSKTKNNQESTQKSGIGQSNPLLNIKKPVKRTSPSPNFGNHAFLLSSTEQNEYPDEKQTSKTYSS